MAKMESFYKVFHIINLLSNSKHGITAEDIKKHFNDLGYDYSLRSAQNDIKYLEEISEFSYLTDFIEVLTEGRKKKIKFKKPPQLIESIIRGNERRYIIKLLEKGLGKNVIEEKLKNIISQNDDYTVYEIIGFELNKYEVKPEILNQLVGAIKQEWTISFDYVKTKTKSKKHYDDIIPLKILIFEDGWYLLAKYSNSNDYRTFLIDHISDVNIKKKIYELDKQEINEWLDKAKTIWFFGTKAKVKIVAVLSSKISYKIKEMAERNITYFSGQKILEEMKDGSLKIEFEVADDDNLQVDFKKQVYPWLPDIEIISPDKFKTFIKNDLQNIFK